MTKLIYSFLITGIFSTLIFSQNAASSAGTSSVLFLRSSVSARISGLAEAYVAVADDENALLYNPAGLMRLKNTTVSLNHTEWLEDIRFDNLIFAFKFNSQISTALSISHMWLPSIQGRDEFGVNTESITVSSTIFHFGAAYKVFSNAYLGMGIKYFYDKLADNTASGIAFDVGYYMNTMVRGLSVGVSVQNWGGEIDYISVKNKLPFTTRAGVSYNLSPLPALVAVDFVKSSDTDLYVNLGTEYIFEGKYSLQVGNQFMPNSMFTPAFGAGLKFNNHYNIFYSFSNPSDLGSTHRFGFKFELYNSKK